MAGGPTQTNEESFERLHGQLKKLAEIWPVVVAILTITVLGARADAQIQDHETRIHQFDRLVTDRTDRLARLEEHQQTQGKQLDRIEDKLDKLMDQSK